MCVSNDREGKLAIISNTKEYVFSKSFVISMSSFVFAMIKLLCVQGEIFWSNPKLFKCKMWTPNRSFLSYSL